LKVGKDFAIRQMRSHAEQVEYQVMWRIACYTRSDQSHCLLLCPHI
jgi:hypothetical protein